MLETRVFFKKEGNIRYISHLDLQRAMTRALIRSGLDIVYTEGFNPHPKISFAVPLSIYQESEYEIMDFKLNTDSDEQTVKQKLSAVMPDGLDIFKVAAPKQKASDCSFAKYRLTFTTDKTAEDIKEMLSGEITVLKKTKTKEQLCDISKQIKDTRFFDSDGKVCMEAVLPASGNEYLNPNYIASFLGENIQYCQIRRLCLYNSKMQPLE